MVTADVRNVSYNGQYSHLKRKMKWYDFEELFGIKDIRNNA